MEEKETPLKLSVMIDCSRNSVMTVGALKKLINVLSRVGYSAVQLYCEDTYEVGGEPYFGYLRGRYSKAELKELDAYALKAGMELVPCVQTLAHLNALKRWPEYAPLFDCDDILLAGDERVYRLIERIFDTLAECFTSRSVNIGMDEAHMLGLGKYLDGHGYENRFDIMLKHLGRVNEIANKRGFSCMMWSDMFFRLAQGGDYYAGGGIDGEIRRKIPPNVKLIYWDYYADKESDYDGMIKAHLQFDSPTVFAGGAWTWAGLAPLNGVSIKRTDAAFAACRKNGIGEAILTMWGDNGGSCSPFSVLPALVAAAEFARGNRDEQKIKARFSEAVGCDFDTFMLADLPNRVMGNADGGRAHNPSKYLLYNDCLLGAWDSAVEIGDGDVYKKHAAALRRAEKLPGYAFLFRPLRLLCEALYYKADLGARTRRLYRAGDKGGLSALIRDRYKPFIGKLNAFYDAFAAYWDALFKPHGFDAMDIRLGGLERRVKHAVRKLEAYISGAADSVPELDEELLDIFGGGKVFEKATSVENTYTRTASVNII
jgi:hypothetical protein